MQARFDGARGAYQKAALNGYREVANSLVTIQKLAEERAQQEIGVEALPDAADLARARYDSGLASYRKREPNSQTDLFTRHGRRRRPRAPSRGPGHEPIDARRREEDTPRRKAKAEGKRHKGEGRGRRDSGRPPRNPLIGGRGKSRSRLGHHAATRLNGEYHTVRSQGPERHRVRRALDEDERSCVKLLQNHDQK